MTNHTKKNNKKNRSKPLTIVGIGASAGGLSALKTFFKNVPENSGLAYVVVVHLSPNHKSLLADLLQPDVKMPIQQVTKTTALKPNQVYVIPPGANLNTIDTHLRLSNLEEKRRERAPIDHFFRTLAKTHDGNSIGIILTGTGSDGTLGIKEIKGKGGLTIVQDPAEAEYDGMPQSALTTGVVDLILPLKEIPEYIIRYANTGERINIPTEANGIDKDTQSLLQKIFAHIRTQTGRDFSRYKRSTIMRRIQRRMQLSQVETLDKYLELLREKHLEVEALSDELLITVTNFFRDKEVYQVLEKEVIPQLIKNKKADENLRVWSVGCATGEEAYSVAILLMEEIAKQDVSPEIQVFASDLHEHSLKKAREGFYPGDIETDVSKERLKKYFVKEDGGYRIRKELRELVVFAPHNLLSDPPFSRIDLITCRNVLIYLQRDVQRDVVELFHYALRPAGFLILGNAETLDNTDLFHVEHKTQSIFRKRNVPVPEPRLPVFPLSRTKQDVITEKPDQDETEPVAYGVLHRQIVERFAPPSMLVSPDYKIVHLSEHVGRYLIHPGGEVTNNVFKLVKENFRLELRTALHNALEKGVATRSNPIPITLEGKEKTIIMSIYPAQEKMQKGFAVVLFGEKDKLLLPKNIENQKEQRETKANDKAYLEMESELDRTKQQLQAIIEEYETSQEEMKASNEEMQSTNEELRSTMEELETSKEELQSMNEELTTLNQENRHKVDELTQLSNDLQNLLSATDIATLFLDRDLRILRFTPRVGNLFNVRLADRGRPLSDYTHRLGYDELQTDANKVLEKLIPIEKEIQDDKNQWYLTRLMPYRSSDDRIEGIVITFIDITRRKSMEDELHKAKEFAELIVNSNPDPLLVLTPDLKVKTANKTFYNHFKVKPQDTEGYVIFDLGNGQWNIPDLKKLLYDVLPDNDTFTNFEVTRKFNTIGKRTMVLNGSRLQEVQLILLSIRDITKQKETELALRKSEERYKTLFDSIDEGFCIIKMIFDKNKKAVDYEFLEVNPAFEGQTGLKNVVGKRMKDLVPNHEYYWFDIYGEVALTGKSQRFTNEAKHLKNRFYDVYAFRIGSQNENKVAIVFRDISESKRIEEALRQSEEHLKLIMKSATDYAIITTDLDRKVTDWNSGAERIFGHIREDVIGKKSDFIFMEEDRKSQPDIEMQIAKEKGHAEDERFHKRKDGSRFWGSGTMMPLKGSSNKLHGFLKILTDNTQKREIEEELKAAKEKAEEAAHAKEEFLAHMSHEIRTPLNAIVGLSALLLEQNPRKDQAENLNTLKFSAENLKILINDILDFSKIQAGKIEIKEDNFKLQELLNSLKKAHTPRANEQGNDLVFEIDEKLPEVICTDQLKLSQVLHNLIGNAVKFTNQGLIKVEVTLQKKKGKHYWLDFSVSDSGIGISKDKLNKIFESFTQEDQSTVRLSEGTGLGLTITKLLLDHMDSKIKVESKKNIGSRFYFTLKVKEGKEENNVKQKTFDDLHDGDLKNFKLLVVEDMPTNRKLILQFLKQWWGFVPDEAKNGKEAVTMSKNNKYNMILMDVRMPEMDGYDATGIIRKLNAHYQDIPIIALTADTIGELKKHNESSLFSGILVKPFDPDDLRETIIKCVTKGKEIQKSGEKALSKPKKVKGLIPVNFTKLESLLYEDKASIQEYLESVLQSLTNVYEDYSKAMSDKDKKLLSDLKHRKTMLIDVLQLNRLKDLLAQSKDLLEVKSIKEEEIQNLKTDVEGEIQWISEELEKKIESLKGE